MNQRIMELSDRFIPILTLFLMFVPLGFVSGICHELGHGLVALAQGGTFVGIVLYRSVDYTLAQSSWVSIGGWLGQYVLATVVLLTLRVSKPSHFSTRSVGTILVMQNLTQQPAYIASLWGDSQGTLQALVASGWQRHAAVILLGAVALSLLTVGVYVSWRILSGYLSETFGWMDRTRSRRAAAILVIVYTGLVWIGSNSSGLGVSFLELDSSVGTLIFLAMITVFPFFAIPRKPSTWTTRTGGPSPATFLVAVLLYVEMQLVFFFVLPITLNL